MDPYRAPARAPDPPAREPELPPSARSVAGARWTVLAWALLRGAVAAARGEWSADVYLVIAVLLVVVPAALRQCRMRAERETGL